MVDQGNGLLGVRIAFVGDGPYRYRQFGALLFLDNLMHSRWGDSVLVP